MLAIDSKLILFIIDFIWQITWKLYNDNVVGAIGLFKNIMTDYCIKFIIKINTIFNFSNVIF